MSYPHLFSTGSIGTHTARNRVVQTPIQTRGGDANGFVTPELLAFHRARTRTAPGVVMAQQSYAWPEVRLARGLGLWDDVFIDGMHDLAQTIKAGGSLAFLQLGGAGSRREAGTGESTAPSPVRGSWDGVIPRGLTREEIQTRIRQFIDAGERIYKAGFDGFSLHGSAGKFIAQFLSPYSNRRTDDFGGSPVRRMALPLRIIQGIRERTRGDFPVIMRMDCCDYFEGGLTLEEGLEQIAILQAGGVDAFLLTGGGQEYLWFDAPTYLQSGCPTLAETARIKRELPEAVIIASGGFHTPEQAEAAVSAGQADFVGMVRPLVADPDFLDKARNGNGAGIRHCLRCNNCQTWGRRPQLAGRGICCTVNPSVMVEDTHTLTPAAHPERIAVVGGGLAGMAAAATLSARGHDVTLFEKEDQLGGQWLAASARPEKAALRTILPYLEQTMRSHGCHIHLHSAPRPEDLTTAGFTQLVLATGAIPRAVKDADRVGAGVPIHFCMDWLRGRVTPGQRVVVLGARYIGMETACALAEEGKTVSLVDMADLGAGMIPRIRGVLFQRLTALGVHVYPRSSLFRLASGVVELTHAGAVLPIQADSLLLAIGTEPYRPYADSMAAASLPMHCIGDCNHIGDARDAIAEGYELGMKL